MPSQLFILCLIEFSEGHDVQCGCRSCHVLLVLGSLLSFDDPFLSSRSQKGLYIAIILFAAQPKLSGYVFGTFLTLKAVFVMVSMRRAFKKDMKDIESPRNLRQLAAQAGKTDNRVVCDLIGSFNMTAEDRSYLVTLETAY